MIASRMVKQVFIYYLALNDMRDPKIEMGSIVPVVAYDKETLLNWYKSELVEPYREDNWYKVFKKGGSLEWYNSINIDNIEPDYFGHGIYSQWINEEDLNNGRTTILND